MDTDRVKREKKSYTSRRLAALRKAIRNGTYVLRPERIAQAMIAHRMESPQRAS